MSSSVFWMVATLIWSPANWSKVALISFLGLFFLVVFYITMFTLVLSEICPACFNCFLSACILAHALILPGIPYRSAIVSLSAILPEGPFVSCLKSQLNAPFFMWKKRDFFFQKLPHVACFHAVHLFEFSWNWKEKNVFTLSAAQNPIRLPLVWDPDGSAHTQPRWCITLCWLLIEHALCTLLKTLLGVTCCRRDGVGFGFWLARVIPYTKQSI